MLVITRKNGESVLIGDDIVVTVIQSNGGQIRLGIEAPKDILIRRSNGDETSDALADDAK